MKLGIKAGLKYDSSADLRITQPDFCEIWFHVNKAADYDNLFKQINSFNIEPNLHFWGNTSNNTLVNLAYPDKQNLQESLDLVKQTIDIAHKNHCKYINMHPGSLSLSKVNFESEVIEFKPYGKLITKSDILNTFYNSILTLASYSKNLGIQLYIESVPKYSYAVNSLGKLDRNIFVKFGDLSIDIIKTVLDIDNVYFANDFGHTLANEANQSRTNLLKNLWTISNELLSKTKLLHVSYIVPPYNGTDYHGSLLFDEFKTDNAIPNFMEMKKLLSIYKNKDVYALVEPISNHVGNFEALKSLISQTV